VKFDYYIFNSYVPELDGDGPELYGKWLDQVQLAEELGFHCAWFTEHHFGLLGGMLPSPQLLTAALAHRTKRIRFGSSVSLLPLHNPLRLAEDVAVLDVLTGGRVEVGAGRGMDQTNYAAFGSDPGTAQERFEEALAVMIKGWTEQEFCWQGRFFSWTKPVTVRPRPVQQPHPPVWLPVSHDPEHGRDMGRHGFNLMTIPWHGGFETTRRIIDGYRLGLRDAGHADGEGEVMGMYYTHVAETPELARAQVERPWANHARIVAEDRGSPDRAPRDYDSVVAKVGAIFGDPEMCREHIRRIQSQLGLNRLACVFHFGGMRQDRVLASMRLFAEEVAPAFA
jgi:alkanesulfonate monooxygenase SsuD/methylene tetrahydromethanopterin reductase-like flavin-dependent oxidoreductase (luciferase family)